MESTTIKKAMADYDQRKIELAEFIDLIDYEVDRSNSNVVDENNNNLLHYLCDGDHGGLGEGIPDIIKKLVKLGTNIDCQNKRGSTPLLLSCHYMRGYEHEYIDEINEVLIELGANVTLADCDGLTPLHIAFIHDDYPLAFYLLKNGANPDTETNGNSGLYNERLVLTSNHSGVEVPIGTKASDLVSSNEMRKLLEIYNSAPQLFKDTARLPESNRYE